MSAICNNTVIQYNADGSSYSTFSMPYKASADLESVAQASACHMGLFRATDAGSELPPPSSKRNARRTPRPSNCFLHFRREFASIPDNATVDQTIISKCAADKWNSMTKEEKSEYEKKAEEEKILHKQQNPGYKYTPKTRGRKNKKSSHHDPSIASIRTERQDRLEEMLQSLQITSDLSRNDSGCAQPDALNATASVPSDPPIPPAPILASVPLPFPPDALASYPDIHDRQPAALDLHNPNQSWVYPETYQDHNEQSTLQALHFDQEYYSIYTPSPYYQAMYPSEYYCDPSMAQWPSVTDLVEPQQPYLVSHFVENHNLLPIGNTPDFRFLRF
ncbi:hypothetical protein PHLCEN_2v3371 [Hermanssonia centrifuga]|uniref:HMG box domain-containing protein n=1 Tax=Hermanssonia centrifuga TaxID=98765 RepID=A0A2R6QM24_9APHY|nr:hypothetical protein PHLCEN_2v3371 [Hermanssonia centrifuga]